MDFTLSEEQQLLKDSVDRFVREEYELNKRRALVATDEGFSRAHWAMMAELGWLGAALPEEYGGIGGGPLEIMVLMEGFGRGLVLEPYFSTSVLGGNLVLKAGSAAHKQELLPKLAAGKLMMAFAYAEPQARYDLFDVETTADKDGDGFVLNGAKGVVGYAACADWIVVSARTAGGTRDRDGITLFLVANDTPGLARRDYPTVDGQRASEVSFESVRLDSDAVLGEVDGGLALIEDVAERAIAALAAEAVGCMDTLLDSTNAYLKTREQFGQPIGKFQVIQHRMADMFIACEEARSMCYVATLRLADPDATLRARSAAAAKVQIGKSARFVGQQSVQLHGGMGMTDEMSIGHYFKRLTVIDTMFGDQNHHLKRYCEF